MIKKIAIDAMGGDFGCEPIVRGTIEALNECQFHAVLFGDEEQIAPLMPINLKDRISIIDTKDVFSMSMGATDVFKNKQTTIYKAIESVRNCECDAVVSAGHSGATMSLATLKIGRLKNVMRPPIATLMPNSNGGRTLVLDVGANVDCKPEHLFQFAIMGEAYAKEILKIDKPKIALLSNGEEDSKGNDVSKESFYLLKRLENFVGNAEGNQIFDASVDVIVCDGFIGNILLKTSEGVAHAMGDLIKTEIKKSLLAILGAVLMKRVFKIVKKATDYDEYGGAPLLGIKNCVIISHGKSTPKAIKNAIFQAIKFSNSNISQYIENEIAKFQEKS